MIIKPYTTKSDLETFLGVTINGTDADLAINSAVQIIDNNTGRNFIADTVATARRFDGNSMTKLLIDECVEITLVERGLDQWGDFFETVPSTGLMSYILEPNNAVAKGIAYNAIILRSNFWLVGTQNQRITAKWGYSKEVPPAIQQATTILAAGIYMYNRGGSSGSVTSEKIGNYAVSYGSDGEWKSYKNALSTIQQFKKYHL
jgi:hypothetical protein